MSGLSIKQKIAFELQRQLIQDQTEKHPLRQLFWESTLRCNMKCRHCGSDCKVSALQPDMPFEDFQKVLLRIKEKYDSHKVMIVVTGGEPLMRKDIAQCCRAIYDMEFPWGMVSNGFLMTPKKIDELLRAGMHSATISLDGFEAEHEWMRGVQGSFKNATEAIRILANEPTIKFDVVTCVNNKNFEQLPQYHLASKLGDYLLFFLLAVRLRILISNLAMSVSAV